MDQQKRLDAAAAVVAKAKRIAAEKAAAAKQAAARVAAKKKAAAVAKAKRVAAEKAAAKEAARLADEQAKAEQDAAAKAAENVSTNTLGYTCTAAGDCRWPDGSPVDNAHRCGTICGEFPTSGEIQAKNLEAEREKEYEAAIAEQYKQAQSGKNATPPPVTGCSYMIIRGVCYSTPEDAAKAGE